MFELEYAQKDYEEALKANDNNYYLCAGHYNWLAFHIVSMFSTADDMDEDKLIWLFDLVKAGLKELDIQNYLALTYVFASKE